MQALECSYLPFCFAAAFDAANGKKARGDETDCGECGDVDPPTSPVTSAEGEVAGDEG